MSWVVAVLGALTIVTGIGQVWIDTIDQAKAGRREVREFLRKDALKAADAMPASRERDQTILAAYNAGYELTRRKNGNA